MSRIVSAGMLLIGLLGPNAPLRAGSIYSVSNLGNLGGSSGAGLSIAGGMIAGYAIGKQGDQTAAYSDGGAFTSLGITGQANGVNANGEIAGSDGTQAFTWQAGKATFLGNLGGGSSSATSVNNKGQAAGGATNTEGLTIAVIFNSDGTIRSLGTLGGGFSSAYAINDGGQAAGTSMTTNGAMAAFLWDGKSMRNLSTLGGYASYGAGINASGRVVGSAQTSAGYLHAFLWGGGAMHDLGTLGGTSSFGYGINDSGSVVGYSLTKGNSDSHAFLYTDGVMTDLNSLLPIGSGWTITAAYGIDNNGDIVGTGELNGMEYAIELVNGSSGGLSTTLTNLQAPVQATPEPLTVLLMGAGLVIVGAVFRHRRRAHSTHGAD